MKKFMIATLVILLVLSYGCTQPAQEVQNQTQLNTTSNQTPPMPGSDRDSHGCIPSAGYTWCDASQKCIRPWEENCTAAPTQNNTPMPGSDRDSHGCIPSAGYTWCESKQKCYRMWEENCSLNYSEARQIAQNSACTSQGNLTDEVVYNNITLTWWLGMDTVKAGCAPACVVYEGNKTAEVNWRCTGLVLPVEKPIVKLSHNPTYGDILTNDRGMTLYVFANDQINNPTCYGGCTGNWPPLVLTSGYTTNVTDLGGTLGTVLRSDKLHQVVYNGLPLYTYNYDERPGDVRGNGISNVWYVATAGMTTFPAVPQPSYGTGGGGGY